MAASRSDGRHQKRCPLGHAWRVDIDTGSDPKTATRLELCSKFLYAKFDVKTRTAP
jgi:hypothetical protein